MFLSSKLQGPRGGGFLGSDNGMLGKGVVASLGTVQVPFMPGGVERQSVVSPKPKWPVLLSLCGLVTSSLFPIPTARLTLGPSLGNGDGNNADGKVMLSIMLVPYRIFLGSPREFKHFRRQFCYFCFHALEFNCKSSRNLKVQPKRL